MSRAFTNEDTSGDVLAGIGERPVSQNRNLVTPSGLSQMDREVSRLREDFAKAEAAGERETMALAARDLRYWQARRETAEVSEPEAGSDVVRFGMAVTLADADGKEHRWAIVGEDEADAAHGTISHASPLARALFGRGFGDEVTVSGKVWEIVEFSTPN